MPAASHERGETPLTNSGVWLLIIAQHLALSGAAFYFILTISRFFFVRLALAVIWASNALFYTFAHCVGSETLSMIFVALVVTKGLRLIRSRCEPRWTVWYVFAIGLCFCILSRHVNLWLILLLPAAFLLSWAQNRISSRLAPSHRQRHWLQRLRDERYPSDPDRDSHRNCLFCFCEFFDPDSGPKDAVSSPLKNRIHFPVAPAFPENPLARITRCSLAEGGRPHSLNERATAYRASGADARRRSRLGGSGAVYGKGNSPALSAGRRAKWEELDGVLNQMAFAFLLPPTPELLHAAKIDFVAALKMPLTDISFSLFVTTIHYFQHKDDLPACAELVTFRDVSADQILQIPGQHLYFRLWRGLTYNKALVIWFISLLVFVVMARRKANVRAISSFGIALTVVGLLMMASTCLVGAFSARYALPMWQLLLLSLYIFAGGTADLFATPPQLAALKRIAQSSLDSKQSAGQRPKLG